MWTLYLYVDPWAEKDFVLPNAILTDGVAGNKKRGTFRPSRWLMIPMTVIITALIALVVTLFRLGHNGMGVTVLMLCFILVAATMKYWWRVLIYWIDGIDCDADAAGAALHSMSSETDQGLSDYRRIYQDPTNNPLYGSEAVLSRTNFDI